MHPSRFALAVFAVLGLVIVGRADNWPRFRGPNGGGVALGQNIPVEFDAKRGVLWSTPMPGVGNSSPVIWEKQIYLLTATKDGKQRSLLALDGDAGKIVWRRDFPAVKVNVRGESSLASATAAVDGDGVYIPVWNGATVQMTAFSHKGEPLWSKDLGAWISQHGTGSSPILVGDKVIFAFDMDVKDMKGNTIPEGRQPMLMAFNKKTGEMVWETPREGYRACYSAPFVQERNGHAEVIVTSTMSIAGYDPASGKELWTWDWAWETHGFKMPLRTVASSVVVGDTLFATSGDGGGDRRMVALKLSKNGGAPQYSWGDGNKLFPYVSTPLARDGYVYFVNEKGNAGCYEAATGKQIWYERLTRPNKFLASPVLVDGRIYAPTDDGEVFVFAAEPTFKLLAQNTLGDRFVASPAVADGRMYLRGDNRLYCIGAAK